MLVAAVWLVFRLRLAIRIYARVFVSMLGGVRVAVVGAMATFARTLRMFAFAMSAVG